MNYFIRVRMSSIYLLQAIENKIANVCERLVAYEHSEKADNVHCHMIILGCTVSTDTLKNYIRSFGFVPPRAGNKYWSFKDCNNDLVTPIVYMSKGKLAPFFVKGFTQQEIDTCKDRWEERSPETSKSSDKKNGPTQYELAMEVVSLLKPRDLVIERHTVELYSDIVNLAIQVHHKHRKGFCEYSLKKVVHTAYTTVEGGKINFVEKLTNNFFYK